MTGELKPCPLCGSKTAPTPTREIRASFIWCYRGKGGCGCSTGMWESREEAIAAWNRRAQQEDRHGG